MPKTRGTKRGDAIEDEMVVQIRRARQRIDAAPGGPLGWVVSFIREDASKWLPGEQEAHGYRLLALVYGRLPDNMLRLGAGSIPPITPGSVEETHAELREWFGTVLRGPAPVRMPIPSEGLSEVLIRLSEPGKKPAIFGVSRSGLRRTLLYRELAALILESDRLLACPKCDEPFLALRKMKFCSQGCLQAWHDAKRPRKGGAR